MKLNKKIATEADRVEVMIQILWCRKHGIALAGLPYFDDLVSREGIHLKIIAPEGTDSLQLQQGLREGYRERDVVRHSVLICPTAWFAAAKHEGAQ